MFIVFLQTSAKDCGPTNQLKTKIKTLHKLDQSIATFLFFLKRTNLEAQSDIYSHVVNLRAFIRIVVFRRKNLILHSSGFLPDLLNSCICLIFKTISTTTIRCEFRSDYTLAYGCFFGYFLAKIHSLTLPIFTSVICCSESIKLHLIEKYSFTNVTVIHNCCTIGVSQPAKKLLDKPKKLLKFLTCAPLIERKNIIETIRLLSLFSDSLNMPISYSIYGNGPLYNHVKSLNLDFVRLEGFVHRESIKYSEFDVYISLSHAEGFSNSLLEASFHGLHLVLSSLPSHLELASYYPYVTFVDDAQALLLSNLFEIIESPSNLFLESYRNLISPKTMTSKYLAAWNHLLQS